MLAVSAVSWALIGALVIYVVYTSLVWLRYLEQRDRYMSPKWIDAEHRRQLEDARLRELGDPRP